MPMQFGPTNLAFASLTKLRIRFSATSPSLPVSLNPAVTKMIALISFLRRSRTIGREEYLANPSALLIRRKARIIVVFPVLFLPIHFFQEAY